MRWTLTPALSLGRERGVVHLVFIILALFSASANAQTPGGITNSAHNLSAAGPGQVRAVAEGEICVFCHTPHNAQPIQPLWNRNVPVSAYTIYSSNSMQALPAQPTGSSKLCLSCHDGTIALGSVTSRSQPIAMAGGITTLPPGQSNLGTDLSDDHPVSFRYDSALISRNSKLKDPHQLPPAVKLDARSEMQCTSCHDAHDNKFGKFLVMSNANSALCNSCHLQGTTTVMTHRDCDSCHKPHTAPSGPYLLKQATVRDDCLACHGGQAGVAQDLSLAADMNKISMHDTQPAVNLPANSGMVTCNDCHEPHTMSPAAGAPVAPNIQGNLGKVSGVSAAGAALPSARFEYEVCFKCHGDQPATEPYISRQVTQNNTRLEFSPSAVSFHPVEAAGKNNDVPSLRPGLTTASVIYCSDCHSSDTGSKAGGTGADGPHGSNHRPLLVANYNTTDDTAESADAYALCYRCHERNDILDSATFPLHRKHVEEERTPCSVCHDAHGISSAQGNSTNHGKLINFDITVVTPSPSNKIEYKSLGARRGSCSLTCHGKAHENEEY